MRKGGSGGGNEESESAQVASGAWSRVTLSLSDGALVEKGGAAVERRDRGRDGRRMRIVITNAVALNSGDGAILVGILRILREAFGSFDLLVLDSHAEAARRLYPDIRFEQLEDIPPLLRRLSRSADTIAWFWPLVARLGCRLRANADRYREADLIISTGGTYLVEQYGLTRRFCHLDRAARSDAPLVLYTQSLGPFRRPSNLQWIRRLAPQFDLVLLRDQLSMEHLERAGALRGNWAVVADAAFALADVPKLEAGRLRAFPQRPRVAVSVRSWSHFRSGGVEDNQRRYRAAVAAAVEDLVRSRNADVTFVSTCQGVPEYSTDDSLEARRIVELLDPDVRARVEVDSAFRRAEALVDLLSGFDLVVATRMHMAILALCAGTPVFPIAYEFKTAELFADLGLGDRVVDIEAAHPESLPGQVDAFIGDLPRLRGRLVDAVLRKREDAWRVAGTIRDLVPEHIRSVA